MIRLRRQPRHRPVSEPFEDGDLHAAPVRPVAEPTVHVDRSLPVTLVPDGHRCQHCAQTAMVNAHLRTQLALYQSGDIR